MLNVFRIYQLGNQEWLNFKRTSRSILKTNLFSDCINIHKINCYYCGWSIILEDLMEKNCAVNSFQSMCPIIDNILTYFILSFSREELTFSETSSSNTTICSSFILSLIKVRSLPPAPEFYLLCAEGIFHVLSWLPKKERGNIKG